MICLILDEDYKQNKTYNEIMIKDIFNEIFGDSSFDELVKTVINEFNNENKKEDKTVNNDAEHSYFHSVVDTYDNCHHTSHAEKEIKNGKVLKDVNEEYSKIADKDKQSTPSLNGCKCDKSKCDCKDVTYYQNTINELKQTIDEKDKQIKQLSKHLQSAENALMEKDEKLQALSATAKIFEEKLDAFKKLFS